MQRGLMQASAILLAMFLILHLGRVRWKRRKRETGEERKDARDSQQKGRGHGNVLWEIVAVAVCLVLHKVYGSSKRIRAAKKERMKTKETNKQKQRYN